MPLNIFNQTTFSSADLALLKCIGRVKLMHAERFVIVYQHPVAADRVITVETEFGDGARYIRDTLRSEWPADLSATRTLVWN